MSIAEAFLAEFEMQAPLTRKFLERVPEDQLTWKPHSRSMTAGQLALHIAGVPGSVARAVQMPFVQAPDFANIPQPASREEVLKTFDESAAAARELLPQLDDAAMHANFKVMAGGEEAMAMPRQAFVRNILFSHVYQHRGQLAVYLRLLEVPVPATWGPSADEMPAFPQTRTAAA